MQHSGQQPDTQTANGLWLKICGLTRQRDALLAAELGARALGFVFYPLSPRAIEPVSAARIIQALPESNALWKVGVFVNADYDTLLRTAEEAGLSHLQLHGDESPQLCERLQNSGLQVIKALRLKSAADLERLEDYSALLLIDAAVPGVWGGSGQIADWELAAQAALKRPCILAGGLKPENLNAASETVRPWGMDLSSGVESSPGIKDSYQLTALFKKAREIHADPN